MKIDVMEYEKKYSFELFPVTQLCGQNIIKKTYIFESLRRYFGTYKYREERNKWRDNVLFDDKVVGRKFFHVVSVSNAADIISMINWSKKSLMVEYVKQLMQRFDWQVHLRLIGEELETMFQMLNDDVERLGDIELTYEMSAVWDMVQKSDVVGNNQMMLEDKESYELLILFLNLIEEVMAVTPKKMLVLIENIDHMISQKEYAEVIGKLKKIGYKYEVYFVLSTSLDGYVVCENELCPGIKIFGEVDFQMPEFSDLINFINDNYPCYKSISEGLLQKDIMKIVHRIGQNSYLCNVEENVICKLINQTLMLYEKWMDTEKVPEIAFLKA